MKSVLAALVLALSLAAAPAGSATYPVPEHDPFYAAPSNITSYADGTVIASRAITATAFQLPLPVKAWQLKYRTDDFRGRPSATVTTVLVPRSAWRHAGPRPLVSYQTAEDGVSGRCAPSYALRAGIRGGFTGSYSETALIVLLLARGWAVSVPDYEGPRSEFLIAGTEGRGVLDGIRAARSFAADGVSPHAPVGLWGYSGGSLASLAAAQLQPTYAPELKLTALAVGGLVANIRAVIDAFSGSIAGSAIPMGITGFLRAYPELHLEQYLNALGRQLVAQESASCIYETIARRPFLRVADIEAVPNALSAPPVVAMLNANSPLYMRGIPRVPTYAYQTIGDEFAPIGPARKLLHRFCSGGVTVTRVEMPLGEHLTELALGAPGAVQYLAGRFAGTPPVNNCP